MLDTAEALTEAEVDALHYLIVPPGLPLGLSSAHRPTEEVMDSLAAKGFIKGRWFPEVTTLGRAWLNITAPEPPTPWSSGGVAGVAVMNAGSGYAAPPVIRVSPPPTLPASVKVKYLGKLW